MNEVFKDVIRKFTLVIFDDILTYSRTWEEHLQHINVVLNFKDNSYLRGRRNANLAKNLSHLITQQGVQMDPDKVSGCNVGVA